MLSRAEMEAIGIDMNTYYVWKQQQISRPALRAKYIQAITILEGNPTLAQVALILKETLQFLKSEVD